MIRGDMKEIPLTRGQVAIVDDEDFFRLSQFSWYARKSRLTYYANRTIKVNGRNRTIQMHREVLGLTDSKIYSDHIDGNGLNNQKSNLRPATCAQNLSNRGRPSRGNLPYKGIGFDNRYGNWYGVICCNYKKKRLGTYATPEEAARAYDKAARELFGEFARLNFPDEVRA